jgi:dTDP-4-amino-4,6-dideoxy-D-galactose acyltransferase
VNKLFIFRSAAAPSYLRELEQVYSLVRRKDSVKRISLKNLKINMLDNVDVVISNLLPEKWRIILKGLKIVSIVFDDHDQRDELTDINIDYIYSGQHKLFSGDQFKISNHSNLNVEYVEIFNLISKLEWDSSFWGFNVAYLSSRILSESILHRMNGFITKNQIRLVEYLCDCHDRDSVLLAEKNGYEFKDIRMRYEKRLGVSEYKQGDTSINFFKAGVELIPKLRKMSENIYRDSRYHYDRQFETSKAVEFYMLWVEKAVKGEYDDECYVLSLNSDIVGFCTIKYEASDFAHIGLVGISSKYRGKGLGNILLNSLFSKMQTRGVKVIHVVTQGRNYVAQRLYQKSGFLTYSTELWYHKWNY